MKQNAWMNVCLRCMKDCEWLIENPRRTCAGLKAWLLSREYAMLIEECAPRTLMDDVVAEMPGTVHCAVLEGGGDTWLVYARDAHTFGVMRHSVLTSGAVTDLLLDARVEQRNAMT